MATKPTPGASDGTYGTEMNTFLDVSLASDGKILDGAVFSTSAAPTVDAGVANKKYVDDEIIGDDVGHDAEGGFNSCDITVVGGATTKTKVYTIYFTGTLDADASTVFAHGVASGATKILSCVMAAKDSGANVRAAEMFGGSSATASMDMSFDDANVTLSNVGTALQSQIFRVRVDYVL